MIRRRQQVTLQNNGTDHDGRHVASGKSSSSGSRQQQQQIRDRSSTSNSNGNGQDDEQSQPIVSHTMVCFLVVVIIGLGFLQSYYNKSRAGAHYFDPFGLTSYSKSASTVWTNPWPLLSAADTDKDVVIPSASSNVRNNNIVQRSLLSPEDDDVLERDAATGLRYHVVFSTDCSPYQHWQSYLVYYTAMKVRQPGHVTRIASGCNATEAIQMQSWFDQQVQVLSKRFHLLMTPHFSSLKDASGKTIGDYKFFNKPFGTKYWMEHSPELQWSATTGFPEAVKTDVIILIDPDMGLLRPITADFSNDHETVISPHRKEHIRARMVSPGQPFAQVYGFGTQWARLDLEKIAGPSTPAAHVTPVEGQMYYPVGPPYLGTVEDFYQIATKWSEFVPAVYEQYPHLLAEMFAFCIAAAHLQLPHQLIDSLMISDVGAGGEGWPLIDQIPAKEICSFSKAPDHSIYALPSVVHMCQRYLIGSQWLFAKRRIPSDIYDCEAPLFVEPPDTLAIDFDYKWGPGGPKTLITSKEAVRSSFMLCYLYSLVNEAATFYKQNSCPPESINLEKTRNLMEYIKSQGGSTN